MPWNAYFWALKNNVIVEFIWKELVASEYNVDNESYSHNLADMSKSASIYSRLLKNCSKITQNISIKNKKGKNYHFCVLVSSKSQKKMILIFLKL